MRSSRQIYAVVFQGLLKTENSSHVWKNKQEIRSNHKAMRVLEWDWWNSTVLTTTNNNNRILYRWGWYSNKVLYSYLGGVRFKSQLVHSASYMIFFSLFLHQTWSTAEILRISIMPPHFSSKSFQAHHSLIFQTSKSFPRLSFLNFSTVHMVPNSSFTNQPNI